MILARLPGRLGVALGVALCCGCGADDPQGPPPNILWITVDTLRADHLGCYGYFRKTSPRIDALAGQSVLFEDCVVPMATTLPSHLSMLTGTWPIEHGVLANVTLKGERFVRSEGLVSFAEVVSDVGYTTAGFISAKPLQSWTGIDTGFEWFDGPKEKERIAQITVDNALAWLGGHQARELESPFFLWVHLFDPHAPFEAPEPFKRSFVPGPQLDGFMSARGISETVQGPNGMDVVPRLVHDLYDAEILYTDGQVGRLLDALDQFGIADDTAVVFLTDHGEGLGQHGVARHGLVWNELLHVAFLLKAPGLEPRRVPAPVSSIDVFPTLIELLDLPGCESFMAQSSGVDVLAPGFNGRMQWSQSSVRLISYGQEVIYALREGRWKYVWLGEESGALYDLRADPFELKDVADDNPGVSEAMRAELLETRELQGSRGRVFGSGKVGEMDAETLQGLRDLGYTGND